MTTGFVDNFESEVVEKYNKEMEDQIRLMSNFKLYIQNYKFIYNWKKPTFMTPPEGRHGLCYPLTFINYLDLRSSLGLMPGGNSFERLIKLFSKAALSPNDEKYIMILL